MVQTNDEGAANTGEAFKAMMRSWRPLWGIGIMGSSGLNGSAAGDVGLGAWGWGHGDGGHQAGNGAGDMMLGAWIFHQAVLTPPSQTL